MNEPGTTASARLLVCFSHLPWDLVFQRPQHLLTRAARTFEVLYIEEPRQGMVPAPELAWRKHSSGVEIATPVVPNGNAAASDAVGSLVKARIAEIAPQELVAWYYTPMALDYSEGLDPDLIVYDCMDELSAFRNPPLGLTEREDQLFEVADLVFTGGHSLFEAKRRRHPRVYPIPSSVDAAHFTAAQSRLVDPSDQEMIPHPRIGFFGVIDERMDCALVARAAAESPDIHFVMVGPVVKIDPSTLPQAPNLHWLGPKTYDELPAYLGNWDAGWMPFALNESTRFISPTKTPEFLAAGLPVTSTAVADVVRVYGASGMVKIADAGNITAKLRASLLPPERAWRSRVEAHLAKTSWDGVWAEMLGHIDRLAAQRVALLRRGA